MYISPVKNGDCPASDDNFPGFSIYVAVSNFLFVEATGTLPLLSWHFSRLYGLQPQGEAGSSEWEGEHE